MSSAQSRVCLPSGLSFQASVDEQRELELSWHCRGSRICCSNILLIELDLLLKFDFSDCPLKLRKTAICLTGTQTMK
jgi:hypothetical protein